MNYKNQQKTRIVLTLFSYVFISFIETNIMSFRWYGLCFFGFIFINIFLNMIDNYFFQIHEQNEKIHEQNQQILNKLNEK